MNIEVKDILDNIKDKGINRKLDDLGRIVIPNEYRKKFGFNSGCKVITEFINDLVVLERVKDSEKIYSRKIDSLGRILIPNDFRKSWNWKEDDLIKVIRYNSYLILKKENNKCVFCFREKNLLEYKDKYICNKCKQELLRKILIV